MPALDRRVATIDLDPAYAILGNTTGGGALPKSVCHAVKFLNQCVYNTSVERIVVESQETKRIHH